MNSLNHLPFTTRHGHTIQLRRLSSSDQVGLATFLGQLSAQTRYLRYFAPIPPLVGEAAKHEIERLFGRRGDTACRQTVVAVDATNQAIIGIAELAQQQQRIPAEIALTVADHYQREGIGLALARQIGTLAVELGLDQIAATILPENIAVRRLLLALGARYQFDGSTLFIHTQSMR